MSSVRFQSSLDHARKTLAKGMIEAVLRATNPATALKKHCEPDRFTQPTHILAFGKASIEMTNAAIECLGGRFARASVISTPELCIQAQFKNKFVELFPATHPLPSPQNVLATNRLIEHAKSIPQDHQALVLLSGGGSAMLCSPNEGVSLDLIIETSQSLMRSGASISELNLQRAQLEKLKSGGLATVLEHVHRIEAFVLSDVIGDDLRTIASGPLVDRIPPTIKHTIIANNRTALDALCAWNALEHIHTEGVIENATGFAREHGHSLANKLLDAHCPVPCAICLGGEPTVDASNSTGVGGPMLELALSCAASLAQADFRWTVITFASDGIDGPTDACGAILTSDMVNEEQTQQSILQALETHNSLPMCDQLGATIRTGATGTNVNDVAIAIRWGD